MSSLRELGARREKVDHRKVKVRSYEPQKWEESQESVVRQEEHVKKGMVNCVHAAEK